jgi:hypothetical protein
MLSYAIDFITEVGRFDRLDVISKVMGDSLSMKLAHTNRSTLSANTQLKREHV